MAVFDYKAKNQAGDYSRGKLEAENVKAAAAKLQDLGLFPVSIEVFTPNMPLSRRFTMGRGGIPRSEIILFTSRLVDLIKGGFQLSRALDVLERQTENIRLKDVITRIRTGVQEGKLLSIKLAEYPELFSKMYVGAVRAGESAGLLESVLTRLAEFAEKEEELKQKIRAALAYPVIMLAVGLASVAFIMAFVIPKFESMFKEMGQLLPLPTRILIFGSSVIKNGWWIYLPVIVVLFFVIKKRLGTENGRTALDRSLLKLPVVGDLIKKEQIARSVRMLGALIKNGVPILDALSMVRESIGNSAIAQEFTAVRDSVKEGNRLTGPMRERGLFPPMVAEMIAVGEETGRLEEALFRVAETYEREVDYSVKTLTSLLEPAIILTVGVVVGFVAISMLLPVFQMSSIVR